VALCGAQSVDEVETALKAGDRVLTKQERDWLDLTSDDRPI
jgi:aryl-alcohol dehydrogenase-like predicted oxidoreductase